MVAWPVVPGAILVNESNTALLMKYDEAEGMRQSVETMKEYEVRAVHSPESRRMVQDYEHRLNRFDEEIRTLRVAQRSLLSVLTFPAILALGWWCILAAIALTMPGTLRTVFAPFSVRFVRRSMLGIGTISVMATGVFLGVYWLRVSP